MERDGLVLDLVVVYRVRGLFDFFHHLESILCLLSNAGLNYMFLAKPRSGWRINALGSIRE
jgi:hypothetical protein